MIIQSQLSQESLNKLNQVSALIKDAGKHEATQMKFLAERAMLNSNKAIDDMNSQELIKFESDLIESFKFKDLIK